jgi:hypothetical protein
MVVRRSKFVAKLPSAVADLALVRSTPRVSLKKIVLAPLSIVAAIVIFCVGYFGGQRAEHRRFVAFQLRIDLALYQAAQAADIVRIKEQLGTVLVARTHTYEALFPQDHSSKLFVEAQRVAAVIERDRGPMIEMPLSTPPK